MSVKSIDDLENLDLKNFDTDEFDTNGYGIVPLPFFYEENYFVADELLSYKVFLPKEQFQINKPYSVRFFLFEKRIIPITNFRNNHDLFIIPEKST